MRAPTMDDVAERAGVSRALVSLVMRGSPKVSDRRRAAVLRAADELGYRPNATARSLAEQRSATIGVVLSDLHNPFFAEVVDGIHDTAVEHGYRLLLNTSWNQDADERRAVETFLEFRLDGVIVVGGRIADDTFAELVGPTPLVSIGRRVGGIDSVVNDDTRGGELVAEHLLDLGHRDIVHIDGGPGGGASGRRSGFLDALRAAGVEPRILSGNYDEGPAIEAVDALVAAGTLPTAVFAANDLSALAALSRLTDLGVDVPGRVSVIGYDDTAIARLAHVALTTIHQPRAEMGRIGMRSVLDRLADRQGDPTHHVVEPTLVRRSTTAPPP